MARGLKPGMTNNPAGRPVGSLNKATAELRPMIKDFLTDAWQSVPEKYAKLEPVQQLAFLEKILPYALPRLRESELKVDFQNLNDAQIDMIVDRLLQDGNH
jgi:hypothetical protein